MKLLHRGCESPMFCAASSAHPNNFVVYTPKILFNSRLIPNFTDPSTSSFCWFAWYWCDISLFRVRIDENNPYKISGLPVVEFWPIALQVLQDPSSRLTSSTHLDPVETGKVIKSYPCQNSSKKVWYKLSISSSNSLSIVFRDLLNDLWKGSKIKEIRFNGDTIL